MPTVITRGSSHLATRELLQEDGTPLLVSSLSLVKVELYQAKMLKHTFVLGTDAVLRASGASALVLELTATLTAALGNGAIVERWVLATADTDFSASAGVRTAVRVLSDLVLQ